MMYTLTVHFTNTIHIIIMLKCYVNNTIFEQFFNKDIVYINEQKEKTMGDNKLVRALGLKEAISMTIGTVVGVGLFTCGSAQI